MPLDQEKECECGFCGGESFAQKRRDQRFKRGHAKRYFNSRLTYRRAGRRARLAVEESKNLLSARRRSRTIFWQTGAKFGSEFVNGKSRSVLRVDVLGVVTAFRLVKRPQIPQMTHIKGVAA